MQKIIEEIIFFRNNRGWKKNDNPESLAKSIVIESAELLANFQWDKLSYSEENVKEEIADILIYTLAMAYDLGFNTEKIIREKMNKNALKYPVKK